MPTILFVAAREVRAQPEVLAEFRDQHRVPELAEHIHAVQEIRVVDLAAAGDQVLHRDLHQHDDLLARDLGLLEKRLAGAVQDVVGRVRHRAEAAALDEHRLLVEDLVRADHLAVGGEHRRVGEPLLDRAASAISRLSM